jgi:Fur family peroxide stress response transcriptional regulator
MSRTGPRETRVTRQKEAILRAAQSSGDHPTADMIYAAVRRELPRISLGTVYRNLQRLVDEGRMSLAPVQDERGRSARFDPETRPHDHFVCERCKRIYDMARDGGVDAVNLAAFERQGFRVTAHTLAAYGVCPKCARRPAARPPARV